MERLSKHMVSERERVRRKERQTDRQTNRQTDRQTEREIERDRENTEREREREKERERESKRERERERQRERERDTRKTWKNRASWEDGDHFSSGGWGRLTKNCKACRVDWESAGTCLGMRHLSLQSQGTECQGRTETERETYREREIDIIERERQIDIIDRERERKREKDKLNKCLRQ